MEPVTDTIKKTSEDLAKTMILTSKKNKKALLANKLLEILNHKSILASYLMSPLSKITNPENKSLVKLVKYPHSKRVNDMLIHNTKPVTLYDSLLTFRDAGKTF